MADDFNVTDTNLTRKIDQIGREHSCIHVFRLPILKIFVDFGNDDQMKCEYCFSNVFLSSVIIKSNIHANCCDESQCLANSISEGERMRQISIKKKYDILSIHYG